MEAWLKPQRPPSRMMLNGRRGKTGHCNPPVKAGLRPPFEGSKPFLMEIGEKQSGLNRRNCGNLARRISPQCPHCILAGDQGTDLPLCRYRKEKERFMATNKDSRQKQPGEKGPGKYHYNPGNQSGKSIEITKPESEQENNVDRIQNRHEQQDN
jgi:hypothetical protein